MISKTQQDFLLGALIGGAVGAVATLILTPLSGASLRKQMADGFNHLNGHGRTAANPKTVKRKAAAVNKNQTKGPHQHIQAKKKLTRKKRSKTVE